MTSRKHGLSACCLPYGKVENDASPALSGVRGRQDFSFTLAALDLHHSRLLQHQGKDAWLIVGVTILLLCLLEGTLSLAFFIKDRFRASDLSAAECWVKADTYSDPSWVSDYYEEFRRSLAVQWRPYVYWRRKPYHGKHINIDTNGIRLTALTQPVQEASRVRVEARFA